LSAALPPKVCNDTIGDIGQLLAIAAGEVGNLEGRSAYALGLVHLVAAVLAGVAENGVDVVLDRRHRIRLPEGS